MSVTKIKFAHLLRKLHLLQFADYIMYIRSVIENRKSNKLFIANHPDFVPPPSYLAFDAYHHTNWKYYYDSGLVHSKLISDLIRENVSEKKIKIFEWGCGPARVIRHLQKVPGFEKVELSGSDYNEDSISWCIENISNVDFVKNKLEPPLPQHSEQFDCVYAISIFTHLSEEMHYAWIQELFRIIKPNGILIFTTHGDIYSEKLLPEEKIRYDYGELIVKDQAKEGKKHFSTFHPPTFVRNKLLINHEVIKHIKNPTNYQLEQEVWAVKKRQYVQHV